MQHSHHLAFTLYKYFIYLNYNYTLQFPSILFTLFFRTRNNKLHETESIKEYKEILARIYFNRTMISIKFNNLIYDKKNII